MQTSRLQPRERERIKIRLLCKVSQREIGKSLGRSHTTIGRELKRNSSAFGYNPAVADRVAKLRQRKKGDCKIDRCWELEQYIIGKMKDNKNGGWTPEQIAGRWNEEHQEKNAVTISYETIYRWIYEGEGRYKGLYLHH